MTQFEPGDSESKGQRSDQQGHVMIRGSPQRRGGSRESPKHGLSRRDLDVHFIEASFLVREGSSGAGRPVASLMPRLISFRTPDPPDQRPPVHRARSPPPGECSMPVGGWIGWPRRSRPWSRSMVRGRDQCCAPTALRFRHHRSEAFAHGTVIEIIDDHRRTALLQGVREGLAGGRDPLPA